MKEFVERGSICHLAEILYGSVLLLSKESILKRFATLVNPIFGGYDVTVYTDITPNPRKTEIDTAIEVLKGRKFDVLVAFGGGSVIDFAKAFRFYQQLTIPLIAIPTTAGTGSEATQFAVVYVDGKKTSLDDLSILPDYSIVDSQFIERATPQVKASPAMDAYCQAIESFWAKKATDESREYAIESIKLCREWLVRAVTSMNVMSNSKMMLASHLAGKAINISRTTAAHALSYKITSQYGIPHGHAVALCLPNLFLKNIDCLPLNQQRILLEAMGISRNQVKGYFHNLMLAIDLEDSCSKLSITDFDEIAESVNLERLGNNPKELTKQDLLEILIS